MLLSCHKQQTQCLGVWVPTGVGTEAVSTAMRGCRGRVWVISHLRAFQFLCQTYLRSQVLETAGGWAPSSGNAPLTLLGVAWCKPALGFGLLQGGGAWQPWLRSAAQVIITAPEEAAPSTQNVAITHLRSSVKHPTGATLSLASGG